LVYFLIAACDTQTTQPKSPDYADESTAPTITVRGNKEFLAGEIGRLEAIASDGDQVK
jgi:hypothetical protein